MIKNFKCLAVVALLAIGFASCSSDDDENAPMVPAGSTVAEVFPEGVPSSVGDMNISTNAKGQVTQITEGTETVKFEYGTFSRATDYQVKMSISDANYPNDGVTFYIQVNERGFAKHALEVYEDDGETDTWDFEYNADGQLSKMKRSEGDNEVTVITYAGGDIAKVSVTDDDNTTPNVTEISYSPLLENKGGIMLFDETFNIDMDEFAVAYYAGLLGMATKHLPTSCVEKCDEYTWRTDFTWTLNSNGFPTKMKSQENGYPYYDEITFEW